MLASLSFCAFTLAPLPPQVFPFFTYVPEAPRGGLGDVLPTALFYARLFTDLTGRLLPRVKALQLQPHQASGPRWGNDDNDVAMMTMMGQ